MKFTDNKTREVVISHVYGEMGEEKKINEIKLHENTFSDAMDTVIHAAEKMVVAHGGDKEELETLIGKVYQKLSETVEDLSGFDDTQSDNFSAILQVEQRIKLKVSATLLPTLDEEPNFSFYVIYHPEDSLQIHTMTAFIRTTGSQNVDFDRFFDVDNVQWMENVTPKIFIHMDGSEVKRVASSADVDLHVLRVSHFSPQDIVQDFYHAPEGDDTEYVRFGGAELYEDKTYMFSTDPQDVYEYLNAPRTTLAEFKEEMDDKHWLKNEEDKKN